MANCLQDKRPEINYPCPWQFVVIGSDKRALELAVAGVVAPQAHILRPSKKSSKGKYISLNLELVVESEEMRNNIFAALCQQPAIRMVI
ncbi:MAG: DUF493 domain-containing protein [Thermodesulfobacteriota bacterium]